MESVFIEVNKDVFEWHFKLIFDVRTPRHHKIGFPLKTYPRRDAVSFPRLVLAFGKPFEKLFPSKAHGL